MPNCKMFTFESKREAGQVLAPQRKLYGNLSNKPPQKAPSSIVCDRKTFLPPSAPKHLLPPSKPAAQLLSLPPTAATGLPGKRHRPQGDSGKSAASDEQRGKASLSSSYNLRSLASKLPVSGLQRPQRSGIPVGFPKAAPGPRTAVSSSTEKLSGCTGLLKAANPVTKATQGKKHPLTKGEPLPLSKKKKMVAGCARCDELEQENRLQSQEIQKLKEELLKWKTRLNC
ncbi:uncharacterized protein V3H82_000582 isoform 2-T2 [Fundulus diaphanus]